MLSTAVRSARAPLAFALLASTACLTPAEARITRLEVSVVESPTFEGRSFGSVGQYEKLRGKAYGEVDPNDPRNAVITDIERAPRNANGNVEYSTDVWIVRPVDTEKGNGALFFELNNRGGNLSFGAINDSVGAGNNPSTAASAGNGFLMEQGFTILEAGWDTSATVGSDRFTISVPTLKKRNLGIVSGPSMDEFVIDADTSSAQALSYPAASLDKAQAQLTWRLLYHDAPQVVPSADWSFGGDGKSVSLSTGFKVGLYEFAYIAKDPVVSGLAFAAVRDVAAFLRRAKKDDVGTRNPLARDIDRVYSFGVSQPARTMHDFVHLGFNEDENGKQVFDGVLNWIGGATGIFVNYRFAQPFRTHRQHIGRKYPEYEFPFANQTLDNPFTGQRDGKLARCKETRTCPKIFEVNSANEYWAKAMSILHTDFDGNDLPDAKGVRNYLISSMPHAVGGYSPATATGLPTPQTAGICQQPRNPLGAGPALRALLLALQQWVEEGTEPPASRIPRKADNTLVPPLPQSGQNFPNIPGVTYNGIAHTGDRFDYGPKYDQGVMTTLPPTLVGTPYPVFVPKTDVDGNDAAGVRLPDVAVPIATYTGWNLRPSGDGCDASGMMVPLAATLAARQSSGDPRLSIAERYPTHSGYVQQVTNVANQLRDDRFLLQADVDAYIARAQESSIGAE